MPKGVTSGRTFRVFERVGHGGTVPDPLPGLANLWHTWRVNPERPESEVMTLLGEPDRVHAPEGEPPTPLSHSSTDPAQILAALGGRASVYAIAEKMEPRPRIRALKDRLKGWADIRKLGGGYCALQDHPSPSLQDWLTHWLGDRRLPEPAVIDTIEREWLHGHRPAIQAWLHQDPGPIRVSQGEIWVFRSRRGPI